MEQVTQDIQFDGLHWYFINPLTGFKFILPKQHPVYHEQEKLGTH